MPTNFRCVHPWSHGTHRGDCPVLETLWSACQVWWSSTFSFTKRHPVVWSCWYRRLMLLGDHSWIVTGMTAERKQLIHASQITAHKTLSAPESPLLLCYVTDWERRGEWDCAWAENLNTRCFVPCRKLLHAFSKPWWQIETAPIILIHPVYADEPGNMTSILTCFM